MQLVESLLQEVHQAFSQYPYYARSEIINRGTHHIKIRLVIDRDLFVQINRNERSALTNFALVHRSQRIYGRDEDRGTWHRHTASAPQHHDKSPESSRPVSLAEFLAEADAILRAQGWI